MNEGTVLVPLTTPALISMIMYYLFGSNRIWSEHKAAGVKPPEIV